VQPGQSIKVVVLKIDTEARKVSLGVKQLESNPWDTVRDKYHVGQILDGKVTRTAEYGAFVELEPGVEGLVHVSEIAPQRVRRITDYVKPDQAVRVKILNIDTEQKRISLSLKEVEAAKAEGEEESSDEEVEPIKPRNIPLRGGIGREE